ncbi:unnamed protein product [Peniophora sp. CBMAI 1063]|nr:unnamed protein product [Peniophora sp. CBMAI 1063]
MRVDRYTEDAFSTLSNTIVDKAPYFGSLPLQNDVFELFFKDQNGQAHSINLASATNEQVSTLAESCSIAPFGRGAQSVIDDDYRKAGKIDLPNFAIPFRPEDTALGRGVREYVLDGLESKRPIRYELDKLNVYGKGGFFKAHKDTPRGNGMFGSLVLIYPTKHSGGDLVFRHQGHEWTFDSASAALSNGNTAFGYAAFYSDIEHEVLPVTSGYRVTITYNLYFDDAETASTSTRSIAPDMSDFAHRLRHLLDDSHFMPQGGYLGFGLRHAYPVEFADNFMPVHEDVQHITSVLKGSDAVILRAAQAAGLQAQLHVAYDCRVYSKEYKRLVVLTTKVIGGEYAPGQIWSFLKNQYGGVTLWPEDDEKYRVERAVHWVTPRTSAPRGKSALATYGNSPSVEHQYWELCLLVGVGPVGERTTKENLRQNTEDKKYEVGYEWLD